MSTQMTAPDARQQPPEPPAVAADGARATRPLRRAGLVAGVSLLLLSGLVVSTVTFLVEFLLALWLVVRSRRVVLDGARHEL